MKSVTDLKFITVIIISMGVILGFASYLKSNVVQSNTDLANLNTLVPVSQQVNSEIDVKFLKTASEINIALYDLGRLAQNHCLRREICQTGEMMEKNYTSLNSQLKTLARNKSIETPILPSLTAQNEYKKVSMNVGSFFDKAFCILIIADLKDAMLTFDRAALECTDPDIKRYAESEMNELRAQLHNALTIQQNYKQESPLGLN